MNTLTKLLKFFTSLIKRTKDSANQPSKDSVQTKTSYIATLPDSFDGYLYKFSYDEFGVRVVNDTIYDFGKDPNVQSRLVITYQDIPNIIKQLNKMYDAWRHTPDV